MLAPPEQLVIGVGGRVHQFEDRETERPFTSFEFSARLGEIPAAVAYLKRKAVSPSYIIFSTRRPDLPAGEDYQAINLQYAIEDGVLGLDWVLLVHRNIEDQQKIRQYIERHGHAVQKRQLNGVSYLRVEDGDLPGLGQRILQDLYCVTPATELGLFVGRITMSPEWRWMAS